MTNLEKILEMKQKFESMNIEVTKGIEVQKKAIDECRKEKAIALVKSMSMMKVSLLFV